MIAFRPRHEEQILSGRKTETRRTKLEVVVGETHAATIGSREFASLRVVEAWPQYVRDFTDEDARAEGYETADQLWDGLFDAYGELDFGAMMFVVRFEVC